MEILFFLTVNILNTSKQEIHVKDRLCFIGTGLGKTGGHSLSPVRMNTKDSPQDKDKTSALLKATVSLWQNWKHFKAEKSSARRMGQDGRVGEGSCCGVLGESTAWNDIFKPTTTD